ncbi:MAG: putative sulfate exporter family transporter, partial [Firmicutes bacterium]|nr:putative sulfate exporter family transporter [Bacillota bacterium]
LIPLTVATGLKNTSKFLMVAALAAIGMNTSFDELKKSGINPMIHGCIISLLVAIVALAVEYFMGLV